ATHGTSAVASDLYPWRWLAWHLSRAMRTNDLRNLVTDARYVESKLALLGTEAVISDIELLSNSRNTREFADALRLSAHVLDADPGQVVSQMMGRLGTTSPLHNIQTERPGLCLTTQTLTAPGGPPIRMLAHVRGVNACTFSSDGRRLRLATASDDGIARLWDVVSGQDLWLFAGHNGRVRACAFSPAGRTL